MAASHSSRRPLKVRQRPWAIALAARLARMGIAPLWISLGSFAASAIGSGCFIGTMLPAPAFLKSALLLCAAAMMQLRLLCNLLDGMVAVEGGRGTPDGELYNDLPDRFSDWILFIAVGSAIQMPFAVTAGWIAAMLAVLTAYVRVLGRASGAGMHFDGPQAKQQRMALLCVACLIGAFLTPWNRAGIALFAALALIAIGSLWTIIRRLKLIRRELWEAKR